MPERDIFIRAGVPMVPIDGAHYIPTVIFYRSRTEHLIGEAALLEAQHQYQVNRNFKLDVGASAPGEAPSKMCSVACGGKLAPVVVAGDFFKVVLESVNTALAADTTARGTRIMLSEPLSLQGDAEWLKNYRANLRELLKKREFAGLDRINFEDVAFMPEPFAVFQYYRYVVKHPQLAERRTQQALVIDFGGGTFDVCVIQTTKEGDISRSGKNSRPLAASSAPIGGFTVNECIARRVFKELVASYPRYKGKLNQGFNQYRDWKRRGGDLTHLSEELSTFIKNLDEAVAQVETPKIALSKLIDDWRLDVSLNASVLLRVPQNPFSPVSSIIDYSLSANSLRTIFKEDIWDRHLKSIVKQAIDRAKDELEGAPITLVLLSGGSANLRWLAELIKKEFCDELFDSDEPIQLDDYQEVVAQGLAIECARKFFNPDGQGDFSAVTYNRLCLVLDVNGLGPIYAGFKPKQDGLPDQQENKGVLLPSASVIRRFIDTPMRWEVYGVSQQPKRLECAFLKSTLDPTDIESLYNVENNAVLAPSGCRFDRRMKLELIVKEDGTATPRFIYRAGRTLDESTYTEGKPFFLDMTDLGEQAGAQAYIGLDFGSSNTSVSFVENRAIRSFAKRRHDRNWLDFADLIQVLPFPLANALSQYTAQMEQERLLRKGREFIEAALSFVGYVSYLEFCSFERRAVTRHFAGFTKRSAGPLWKLLQETLTAMRSSTDICRPFIELLKPEARELINETLTFVAQHKHEKAENFDLNHIIKRLANLSVRAFNTWRFGYFLQCSRKRFSAGQGKKTYDAVFRDAHGNPPFTVIKKFTSSEDFVVGTPYLLNLERGAAMELSPLLIWLPCEQHRDAGEPGACCVFDSMDKSGATFKAVQYSCGCSIADKPELSEIVDQLLSMREKDSHLPMIPLENLQITD